MELEFELNASEKRVIKDSIGIRIGDTIPVRVTLKYPYPTVTVPKKGSPAFKTHSSELAAFVCKRIAFKYIPTVRTEGESLAVISDIIDSEMEKLDKDEEYNTALQILSDKNRSVFNDVSLRIEEPLKAFLPNIKSVRIIANSSLYRPSFRRGASIIIDDGTATSIEMKGDGIKSLTALALLSSHKEDEKASIIAIEEPESHLHPEAIHQLNETIQRMAENNQVILSTHNPAFVNKHEISSNIIVDNGKAVPAKNIKQIRDILGVTYSDNMINANTVLVVEGEEDKKSLYCILPAMSEKIRNAINNGTFIIDEIGGSGNLSYKLSLYRNVACQYHILLDNDAAGQKAFSVALSKKLASIKTVTFTNCKGRPEAEFEDALLPKVYRNAIKEQYGVNISVKEFRGNKKWSDRIRECFLSQGKPWNDQIEKQVKETVANTITGSIEKEISPSATFLQALVNSLEAVI